MIVLEKKLEKGGDSMGKLAGKGFRLDGKSSSKRVKILWEK